MADFDEALSLDPRNALAHNNRGVAYNGLGEYQRAIEDLNEAIRLDPKYAAAYANRAIVYSALGKDTDAQHDARRAIELGFSRRVLEAAIQKARRQR